MKHCGVQVLPQAQVQVRLNIAQAQVQVRLNIAQAQVAQAVLSNIVQVAQVARLVIAQAQALHSNKRRTNKNGVFFKEYAVFICRYFACFLIIL